MTFHTNSTAAGEEPTAAPAEEPRADWRETATADYAEVRQHQAAAKAAGRDPFAQTMLDVTRAGAGMLPSLRSELSAEVADALDRAAKAQELVIALCKPRGAPGAREWTMSIPARIDEDPDLVIGGALRALERVVRRLATPAGRASEAHRA